MTRLDRRALFASGAAAALLAATGLSAQAAPRTGGTLRLAVPREDDILGRIARRAVFETLTEIGPDGTLRGELATGWQSDAAARIWSFRLRDGVRFHDDVQLHINDVIASLGHLPHLASATEVSEGHLQLELTQPVPDLPLLLAQDRFQIAPNGEQAPNLPDAIGTGCYKVARAQEGRHFRATRVDGHHRSGRAGWADAIEIVVIPDPTIRAEGLRDGYVDMAMLPQAGVLLERDKYLYHPSADDMQIALSRQVGMPARVGTSAPLDDLRIAERWWLI